MTLEEAREHLALLSSGKLCHIVANEDGSFSIVGLIAVSESEKLEDSLYDTLVVTTNVTTRPGGFLHLMQTAAARPITLRELVHQLIAIYRPPRTKKNHEMVIRVRTRNAYNMGYLRQVK
jgi:hypothetical protein